MLAVGCWLLSGHGVGGASPAPVLPRYRVDAWKIEHGLPQNTVQAILQTRDGYLWIGTRFGLARFDGVRFTVFDRANTPALVSDTILSLAEDDEGGLWIGTNFGLVRRAKHHFQRYTTEDGLPHHAIQALHPSRDGGVWVGTSRGYCRFLGGRFTNYNHLHGAIANRTFVHEDPAGTLRIADGRGLLEVNPAAGTWRVAAPTERLAGGRPGCLTQDREGRIWLGTGTSLFSLENDGPRRHVPANFEALAPSRELLVEDLFASRQGILWLTVGPSHKLVQFRDGQFTPFQGPEGRPIDFVHCFAEDREGNLWLGTRYQGLIRLQPRRLETLATEHGLADGNVWSVAQGPDGAMWIGTARAGFSRAQNGQVTTYQLPVNLESPVKTLLADAAGEVWLGLGSARSKPGLWRFKDGRMAPMSDAVGIRSKELRALFQDRSGLLWIGSDDGLFAWRDAPMAHYDLSNGLSANSVRAIYEDRQGNLWIGTQGGGVQRLRDGRFTTFTTRQGLSNNSAWAFHEDAEGTLWIGTEFGLNRFKDGRFFVFTRQHGLFDDLVNHLLEDDAGSLWISCNRGIYRVPRQELNAVAEGRAREVHCVPYGEADGMLSSETNGEQQPAGWKTRDGQFWFPTIKGVVIVDPRNLRENEVPPSVTVEQVIADGQIVWGDGPPPSGPPGNPPEPGRAVPSDAPLRLAPGRGRVLEIRYTANSFTAPEKVRFRFKLDGHDNDWREADDRRVAYYTNLDPGQYRFRVLACNNHGVWNLTGATLEFALTPAFYQTWNFFLLCAAGLAVCALAFHRMRLAVATRLQQLESQEALHLERARIAQDLHDDLGASLTQVAIWSEVAKRELPREQAGAVVERISATARDMVDSITEIIWAINPRHDTLENLCAYLRQHAALVFEETRINCRLDFPADLPPRAVSAEFRRGVFLLLKEALNNVIKHSAAATASVSLRLTAAPGNGDLALRLEVADDGKGFETTNVARFSNGLENMRKRAAKLGGAFELHSRPGKGTTLAITVPLAGAATT